MPCFACHWTFLVFLLDQQRHQSQQPEIGEHHHRRLVAGRRRWNAVDAWVASLIREAPCHQNGSLRWSRGVYRNCPGISSEACPEFPDRRDLSCLPRGSVGKLGKCAPVQTRPPCSTPFACVIDPDLGKDIVSLGFVKQLAIDAAAPCAFAIELTTPACPVKDRLQAQAGRRCRRAGRRDVRRHRDDGRRAHRRACRKAARQPVAGVKNVIAVGAGKGGVGKTTVAVNLAVALAQLGSRVGMIDGDIYGPNVPMMLGLQTELVADEQGRIIPAERYGVQRRVDGLSDAGRLGRDLARPDAARRDPAVLPAGGLGQSRLPDRRSAVRAPATSRSASASRCPCAGAIVVTTPQQVSLADTRRAVRMYQKLNIRPLGTDREHEPLRVSELRARDRTSSDEGPAKGWRTRWRFRSSGACRSTSRFESAATADIRSCWRSRTRRRPGHSDRWRSRPRRRSRLRATPG